MEEQYLEQRLLIAMPGMQDPNFKRGVILLCQHNDEGALGINVHNPTNMRLSDIFAQMDIECRNEKIAGMPVLAGGPVQPERGFVLHDGQCQGVARQWESSLRLGPGLMISTSRDILEDIAGGHGPDHFLVALGYAGWAAGQLEHELRENAWLNARLNSDILFKAPAAERWRMALDSIGVQHPDQISWQTGNA